MMFGILRWQAIASWRRLTATDNSEKTSLLLVLIACAAIAGKYAAQLALAWNELHSAAPWRIELLLTGLLLAWLLPLLGGGAPALESASLVRLPLREWQLFGLWTASVFLSPVVWLLAGASIALWMPLGAAPHAAWGRAAAAAFVAASLGAGLVLAQVNASNRMRRVAGWMGAAGALAFVLGIARVDLRGASAWLPGRLVTIAALHSDPRPMLLLLGAAVLLWWAAYRSFVLNLEGTRTGDSGAGSWWTRVVLPGPHGGLFKKDVALLARVLDVHAAALVSAMFCSYFAGAPAPSLDAMWFGLGFVAVGFAAPALNQFGLDRGPGLDRLALLPLRGGELLIVKDAALALMMAAVSAPLLIAAATRFGAGAALAGACAAAASVLLVAAWGNWVSVVHATPAELFQFHSGGPVLHGILGVALAMLPPVAAARILPAGPWWIACVTAVAWLLWRVSLRVAGERLRTHWEELRLRLD